MPAPGNATPLTKDLYVVTPKGEVKQAPPPKLDKRSEAAEPGEAATPVAPVTTGETTRDSRTIMETVRSWIAQPSPEEAKAPVAAASTASTTTRGVRLAQNTLRQGSTLAVDSKLIIIQFKPTATDADVQELIRKYGLKVEKVDWDLLLLYVTADTSDAAAESQPRTRSLAPPAPAAPKTIGGLLEPDILKKIRSESAVNAALMQSTLSPKGLPRRSELSLNVESKRYDWTWRPGIDNDGNWGLKRLRLPPVWHILSTMRSQATPSTPALMGFLDTGFGWHGHLKYNLIYGLAPGERPIAPVASCEQSHGTHVAGIAGAAHGLGRGIDGILPDAVVDAIPITDQAFFIGMEEGVVESAHQRAMLFTEALRALVKYLRDNPVAEGRKRVINISLGYNWRGAGVNIEKGDITDQATKTHVVMSALMIQQTLEEFEGDTLFVIAAGNDSAGLAEPLHAKWASPFAYLGLAETGFRKAENVIVVEAVDRTGNRAQFSNVGGHVAAPGTEVMSTLAGRRDSYGVCTGTSQAAPHITALAAILMEVAPTLSPAQVAKVIRDSAIPAEDARTAPRADALNAVIAARPESVRILADLNRDGRVDGDDLATFQRHYSAMTTVFQSTHGVYFFDLNEDGDVAENEQWYPRIDLNGSGQATPGNDKRCIGGVPVSDLGVISMAWSDPQVRFADAAKAIGMKIDAQVVEGVKPEALAATNGANPAAGPPSGSKATCKW